MGIPKKKICYFLAIVTVSILCVKLIDFIQATRTPIEYAVGLADITESPNMVIIVRETWHTGTGWEMVGDKAGLFGSADESVDVKLEGNEPPTCGWPENVNLFLCEVIPTGTYRIAGTTDPMYMYDKYAVINWNPIYPVQRNTILPSWFYPDNYLSKADITKNPNGWSFN